MVMAMTKKKGKENVPVTRDNKDTDDFKPPKNKKSSRLLLRKVQ